MASNSSLIPNLTSLPVETKNSNGLVDDKDKNTLLVIKKQEENKDNKDSLNINPWYITGLGDGDSSFWVIIVPNPQLKIGYEVRTGFSFVAAINPANYKLMLLVYSFF